MKKKLLIAVTLLLTLFVAGYTQETQAFSTFYEADFGDGVPDDWTLENAGSISSDGTATEIRTNNKGEEFSLYSDVSLPEGFYEISINGWYGSDTYDTDDTALDYIYTLEEHSEIGNAQTKHEHETFTFFTGQYEDARLERLELKYEGNYNTTRGSEGVGDFMQIESVEIKRVTNVESIDYLRDFEGGIDTTVRSIDEPSTMTEENLENASVYGTKSMYGADKLVEKGEAMQGETYEKGDNAYEASWSDEGGSIFMSFAEYYDTEQGDVVMDDMDDYPYDMYLLFHDESLEEDEEYDYPLSDFYFLQYEISQDNIDGREFVEPSVGNPENVTGRGLYKSHIVIENEGSGNKTEIYDMNEVVDEHFNEADNFVNQSSLTEQQLLLENDEGRFPETFSFIYKGDSNMDKGDLAVQNVDLDSEDDTMFVNLYIPKGEEGSITPQDPDSNLSPNEDKVPEGMPQVLSYFGLWNFAGVMALFASIIITVNVALVFMGVKNMGLVVVDLLIYGLFAYMGLLMTVHHLIIVSTFLFVFILIMKGGGAVE